MKKLNLLVAPAFVVAMTMSASAFAASATVTDATVTIKTPIAVSETSALIFGTIIPTVAATPATVVLDFADSATSADATITGEQSGDFNVTGADNSSFTLSGLGTVQMSNGNAADNMALVLSSSPAAGSLNLVSGSLPIAVGGTLSVGANQPSGDYTAAYTVTVNY